MSKGLKTQDCFSSETSDFVFKYHHFRMVMQRTDGTPLLTAQGLTMSYPGVKALGGVDFDLRSGEIHALCGENGAGKSTLIKILGGIIPHGAFGGKVTVQGTECRFNGPADALQSGIRVIHQELALCEDLTVAENVCLGEEPSRFGLLDRKRMRLEAAAQLERLGLMDINPDIRAGTLPVGLRQMVEIARALRHPSVSSKTSSGSKVLILDEPTSALSAREAERLEATLHRLRNEGYALLYISHRLDEVFRLADRITVLRNGESAGTLERNEFNPDRVISMMVGRTADELFPTRTVVTAGSDSIPITVPLLSVRNWILPSPQNPDKHVLENISFDLHAGEILGIVGLMGAGRTELAESLCGLFPLQGRGEIKVEGKAYVPKDAGHALKHGLALLCEDRRGHGVMPDKSVAANSTYASLRDYCLGGWLIRRDKELEAVNGQINTLRIKTPNPHFNTGNLSGGNQQKVLIGRWLLTRPKILILDEPTRGIDVGAKAEIYRLIQKLASEGMGIILISSENEEVLQLSHRILVLRNGHIMEERTGGELELEEAMSIAAGGTT
jgi:D-xylose transport system ATP-binding protein